MLCLLGWAQVKAQPRLLAPEFYVGVHGGVTASTVLFTPAVTGMTPITNACVLGGNGGVVFRYAGHKYCGFQMELNYEHRGWTESGTAHNLHYIELPVLMNLNFGSDLSNCSSPEFSFTHRAPQGFDPENMLCCYTDYYTGDIMTTMWNWLDLSAASGTTTSTDELFALPDQAAQNADFRIMFIITTNQSSWYLSNIKITGLVQ